MSGDEDLRGSAPMMTTKDLLLELWQDVKELRKDMSVLTSQDLDERLSEVESWRDRVDGRVNALLVAVTVGGSLLTILVAALGFGKQLQ